MKLGHQFKLSLLTLTLCVSAHVYAIDTQDTSNMSNTGQAQVADKNRIDGESFLNQNKNRPGIITLPDGLQYKVIKEGNGAKPADSDTVTVNYAGRLIDGTEFDSSYKRGEPATFPVSGVIPGWTEALKLMKVGSVWELYIPSQLAYGSQGVPGAIGPNQVLVFQVELLAIK